MAKHLWRPFAIIIYATFSLSFVFIFVYRICIFSKKKKKTFFPREGIGGEGGGGSAKHITDAGIGIQ